MPRKMMFSKRKSRRTMPFNIFEILYETGSSGLFEYPDNEPGSFEIGTLHEHGITLEEFKKNRKKFAAAYKLAKEGKVQCWYLER